MLAPVPPWRVIAAANNAAWCARVCRSHGLVGITDARAWTCRVRTPPLYPDAVTLRPQVSIPPLLSRIDPSAGCSIKDSFASVNLTEDGFRVLVDAQWVVHRHARAPLVEEDARWEVVRDPAVFRTWEQTWRGDGPSGVLLADLLDDSDVAVIAQRRGTRVVGGAVLSRAAGVVGVSNLFAAPAVDAGTWASCLALAARLFPSTSIVGYEAGDALAAAVACGLEPVGALRVWLKD